MVPLYVAFRRQRQIVPSKMMLGQCTTFDNSRRNTWCCSAYLSLKAKASSFFVICIRTCILPPASSQIFPLAVYIEQAHNIITSMFTRAWDLPMCVTHSPKNISRLNRRGWECYHTTFSTKSLNLRRNELNTCYMFLVKYVITINVVYRVTALRQVPLFCDWHLSSYCRVNMCIDLHENANQ